MKDRNDYYTECISEAICEHEISKELSAEQIEDLADHISDCVTCAVENESMAFGWDIADANLSAAKDREKEKLKEELRKEQSAVWCGECKGTGRIRTYGPSHYADMDCYKCNGKGKLYQ